MRVRVRLLGRRGYPREGDLGFGVPDCRFLGIGVGSWKSCAWRRGRLLLPCFCLDHLAIKGLLDYGTMSKWNYTRKRQLSRDVIDAGPGHWQNLCGS